MSSSGKNCDVRRARACRESYSRTVSVFESAEESREEAAGPAADSAEEEGAVLRMGLRTLSLLVPKMSSATVYAALQDLMPPVLSAINSPVSATRKEAVFLFVRVYNSVGDAHARPYMGKLSVAQSKLVTIYVQRSRQAGTGKISQK